MLLPDMNTILTELEKIILKFPDKKLAATELIGCEIKNQMVSELKKRREKNLDGDLIVYISDESGDEPDEENPELLKLLDENAALKKSEMQVLKEFFEKQKQGPELEPSQQDEDSENDESDEEDEDEPEASDASRNAEQEDDVDADEEADEEEEASVTTKETAAGKATSPLPDPEPVEEETRMDATVSTPLQAEEIKEDPLSVAENAAPTERAPSPTDQQNAANVNTKASANESTQASTATSASEQAASSREAADVPLAGESGIGKGEEAEIIPSQKADNDIDIETASSEPTVNSKRKITSPDKLEMSKRLKLESPSKSPSSKVASKPAVIDLDDEESDRGQPIISNRQIELIELSDSD